MDEVSIWNLFYTIGELYFKSFKIPHSHIEILKNPDFLLFHYSKLLFFLIWSTNHPKFYLIAKGFK